MTTTRPGVMSSRSYLPLAGLALLAASPAALAQVQQNLSVAFVNFIPAMPVSDWVTAGIALLLGAGALVTLRRQTGRAARLSGWLLALLAGATLIAATGQRIVSDASAGAPPGLSLTSSPSTISVAVYAPTSPLGVTVTNNSGQSARLTGITLDPGFYSFAQPTTCIAGSTILAPGDTCTITLVETSCAAVC